MRRVGHNPDQLALARYVGFGAAQPKSKTSQHYSRLKSPMRLLTSAEPKDINQVIVGFQKYLYPRLIPSPILQRESSEKKYGGLNDIFDVRQKTLSKSPFPRAYRY